MNAEFGLDVMASHAICKIELACDETSLQKLAPTGRALGRHAYLATSSSGLLIRLGWYVAQGSSAIARPNLWFKGMQNAEEVHWIGSTTVVHLLNFFRHSCDRN